MVNVFVDSVANGPGNLLMVKKVVVTKGKTIGMKFNKAMCLDLNIIDYTRIQVVHLLPHSLL